MCEKVRDWETKCETKWELGRQSGRQNLHIYHKSKSCCDKSNFGDISLKKQETGNDSMWMHVARHMALKSPPIAIHQAAVFRACRSFEVPPGQNRAQEQTNSGTLPETKQIPFHQ